MFSGRHEVAKDENGKYFIDRDPILFRYILDFMRSDILPPPNLFHKVYEEAIYLSFDALIGRFKKTFIFFTRKFVKNIPISLQNLDQERFFRENSLPKMSQDFTIFEGKKFG